MKNTNKLIVHTNLYSKIALEVLQSVEGQLSDGIWENSPAMEKYWRFSNVMSAPDGEVLIEISKESYKPAPYAKCGLLSNGFYDMDPNQIIEWFAAKVKHVMQVELKDEEIKNGWKRTNDAFETRYLSYNEKITVRDVYFIYDFLMDRDVTKKYEGDMSLKIKAAPKSDEETKKEEDRRATVEKLNIEWAAVRKSLEEEKKQKIKLIEDEYVKQLNSVNDKFTKLRDSLASKV